MAGPAIVVDLTRELAVGTVLVVGGLMLMVVMTQVLRLAVSFVLAIGCHGRPTQLERQQNQQEDGEQATHGLLILSGAPLAGGEEFQEIS